MAMSDEHKKALAQGRLEARSIKAYLDVIGNRKRGRPITPESLKRRIKDLETRIAAENSPLKAVELRQARLDAERRLAATERKVDLAALEAGFVAHVVAYSSRKGISYAAWREAGVPAAILRKARLPRTG